MYSVASALKSAFGTCVRDICKSNGCELHFDGFPSDKVILHVDCLAREWPEHMKGKRCDFIVVVQEGKSVFLLPVEFKTLYVVLDKIKSQLESGIIFLRNNSNAQFECYPVLVTRRLQREAGKKLQKIKIEHNGKAIRVRHVRCNKPLSWRDVKRQRYA